MAEDGDEVHTEEVEAFHREQAIAEMEAQLHHQEQGIIEMERAFLKRTEALRNLVSYLGEQEQALLQRAESIGPRAQRLVADIVAREDEDELLGDLEFEAADDRTILVDRRQELMDARMALVEDREALYERRHELLDEAESTVADLEEHLLGRELEISQALRKLITSASELTGPLDEDALVEDLAPDAAEDRARTQRRPGYTTQVRFNLEAKLGSEEAHHFFRYEGGEDADGALPGLFIATPNLLKEQREVEVDIGLGEDDPLRAKGVVAWRRKPGADDGPAGMGIDLTWVEEEGRSRLDAWLDEHPPREIAG